MDADLDTVSAGGLKDSWSGGSLKLRLISVE
jgi:hypothetical protein